ncbi:MAG: DUF4115 domain-containing protein [Sphingomonadales bacterium]|nr:DUF4115 domain-containing protein [Sphingomonadales bacterium]
MGVEQHMAELPLEGAGARLRIAREAAGRSRADIAAATKISERLLAALEDGNYAALPARAYATGFARSYARAVGLDAEAIVRQVRAELDGAPVFPEQAIASFEPGDPARVPSRRLAWGAAVLVLLVLAGLAAWRLMSQPAEGLPSILPSETPAPAARPAAPAPVLPAASGPVVITADAANVWLRVSDGERVLLQKNMAQGESFAIPADAVDPRLRTSRPDALAITIGGQPVARIADRQMLVSDVSLTATALLARGTAPSAAPAPAATTTTPAIAAPASAGSSPGSSSVRPRPRATATAAPTPAPAAESPAAPAPAANPSTATP